MTIQSIRFSYLCTFITLFFPCMRVCVCVYIAVCIHIHIFCSRDRCALNFSSITIIFFIHHYFICNVRFEYMCIMGLLILFCFHSGIFHPTQLLVRSFVVAFTLFLFDSFLVSLPLYLCPLSLFFHHNFARVLVIFVKFPSVFFFFFSFLCRSFRLFTVFVVRRFDAFRPYASSCIRFTSITVIFEMVLIVLLL